MLPAISAKGTPYDFGFQIGMAVRQTVHLVSVHNSEFLTLEEKWLGSDYAGQLLAAAKQSYPRYVKELEGMAAGVDLPFERIFLWNCRGDLRLPDNATPAVVNAAADGCTTLMIPGDLSLGKSHLIGHNEDGSDDLHGSCFWLKAKPDDGLAFESYLYPGMMAGHTLGVNGLGLVQTINNIRVHDLKPGIPRHFISRAVLDCETLDQATEVLSRTDRASGFHHNLGQAGDDRLLSVEAPASGCVAQEIIKPSAHANHLIQEPFSTLDQSITKSSLVRQQRASQMVDAGIHKEGGVEAVLFDRTEAGKTIHRMPGDGSDDYGRTLVTGVFSIGSNTVDWALHDGPDQLSILSS